MNYFFGRIVLICFHKTLYVISLHKSDKLPASQAIKHPMKAKITRSKKMDYQIY